jgi:hypothetical protein
MSADSSSVARAAVSYCSPRQPGLAQRARQAGGCLTGPNPTDRGKLGSKFAWIAKHRRTVRDYERLPAHHEAMVKWAMVAVMTRRLARKRRPPRALVQAA